MWAKTARRTTTNVTTTTEMGIFIRMTRTIQIWMVIVSCHYHPSLDDKNDPNLDGYCFMSLSSRFGWQEQSKCGCLLFQDIVIQVWMPRTIQKWNILSNLALYIRKCIISFHFWKTIVCDYRTFQKWMIIGPSFPSIFGTGTYMGLLPIGKFKKKFSFSVVLNF